MDSPDFFIMDDDHDQSLGLSITCPTTLVGLEFSDSFDLDEAERDPLSLDFELSPPFYSQLHSLFLKPVGGALCDSSSCSLDENSDDLSHSIDLKPSGKYFIKTMKPKRRPTTSQPPTPEPFQCFSSDVVINSNDFSSDVINNNDFSNDIINSSDFSNSNDFASDTNSNDISCPSEKPSKLFYCRSCGKSFKFQTSLLRHNNKVHISKYACPTCQRVFSRQAYLDVHTSKLGSSCYLPPPSGNYHRGK